MKKAYESPVAEKIAFNYRDQVVAASGGSSGGSGTVDDNTSPWVSNTLGCLGQNINTAVREWGDWRLCVSL